MREENSFHLLNATEKYVQFGAMPNELFSTLICELHEPRRLILTNASTSIGGHRWQIPEICEKGVLGFYSVLSLWALRDTYANDSVDLNLFPGRCPKLASKAGIAKL